MQGSGFAVTAALLSSLPPPARLPARPPMGPSSWPWAGLSERLFPAAYAILSTWLLVLTPAVRAAEPAVSGSAATALSASADASGRVTLEFRLPETASGEVQGILYRSFLDIGRMGAFDLRANPITRFDLGKVASSGRWTDSLAADGMTYWYYLKAKDGRGREFPSQVARASTPPRPLPPGSCDSGCALLVDKVRYILELRRGETVLKRYPVNLGADPVGRKLHQDNSTTPEGCYRIDLIKPQSQFHKAYRIDYPNRVDRERYAKAKRAGTLERYDDGSLPDIGGAVQIHGGGVGSNWTWGCMAMENAHIDELFANAGLKAGTPVHIAGNEVKREELLTVLK